VCVSVCLSVSVTVTVTVSVFISFVCGGGEGGRDQGSSEAAVRVVFIEAAQLLVSCLLRQPNCWCGVKYGGSCACCVAAVCVF